MALYQETAIRESFHESTLNDLPVEILCKIFIHSLPEKPSHDSIPATFLLCSISVRWRHIAISLPYLWKHLHIDTTKYTKHPAHLIRMGELWLERSHFLDLPFSVSIQVKSKATLLNLFISKLSRYLRTLSVDLWNVRLQVCLTNLITSVKSLNFQALETLVLDIHMPVRLPRQTPNLQKLRVRCPAELMNPTWKQLTHLDIISRIDFSDFLTVVSQCLCLIDGEFRIAEIHDSITVDILHFFPLPAVPVLHQLRRLVLHHLSGSMLGILPSSSFVTLEDLGLIDSKVALENLRNNIPISGTVTQLMLSIQSAQYSLPIQMLRNFDCIASLTLCCSLTVEMDWFFRDLATSISSLLRLTHFNLYLEGFDSFDVGLYAAIISKRRKSRLANVNARLKNCSLVFISAHASEHALYNFMITSLDEVMKPFVDDGLDFSSGILLTFPSFSWSPFS